MTAVPEPRDVFHYTPLPDAQAYIRLLRIRSSPPIATPEEELVECELTSWRRADAPPYRALSYTWGDLNSRAWSRVNGQHMQIQQNCEYMLRQVYRHSGPDCYVWVDSICINQEDIPEKNAQVSGIGDVYAKAERVLACVGAHDASSRFLFDTLVRQSDLFTNWYQSKRFSPWKRACRTYLRWRYGSSEPRHLARALNEFLCRPYFHRVWTLSELWLAVRGVDILCGEDSLPDEFFRGLHQCIQQDELLSWVPLDLHHIPLLRRAESLGRISGFSFSDSPPHLVAIYKRLSSLRFDEAMRYSASLQCQDERDRVYALISIVDWGNKSKKRIEPDYEIDVYDLAINLLHWAARDAMSSGWTNLHPGVPASVISLAESVMEGLRINAQTNHKLAQAIQDRYRPATSSKASTYDVQKVLLDEEYAYVCQGFQLRFDNDKWKMDVPEHAHDPSSKFSCFLKTRLTNKQNQKRRRAIEALKEPHHLVSGDSGEPQFLLPLSAEPGDWIVSFEENYLLILREQANGRYNIIGEARGLPDILQCINIIGTVFKVYLGPEDYYLLCLRRGRRRDTDFVNTDQESIIHSLENAVSTAEGSSYAEMAFWEGNRDSSTYISPTATAMTEKKNPVTA